MNQKKIIPFIASKLVSEKNLKRNRLHYAERGDIQNEAHRKHIIKRVPSPASHLRHKRTYAAEGILRSNAMFLHRALEGLS